MIYSMQKTVLSALLIFSCCTKPHFNAGTTTKFSFSVKNEFETIAILSVPKNYKRSEQYPLLIALHGHGSNAEAFHDLWKSSADSMNIILLTPQGEMDLYNNISFSWGKNTDQIIFSALDMIGKHININPKEIYLTGFSLGGTISYSLGLRNHKIFKGIAPICGQFKESFLPKDVSSMREMKIYIGHGELDKYLLQAQKANELLSYIHRVKLKIYNDTGHTIPEPKKEELINIIKFFLS